jgi:hypothetical protein
MKICRFAATAPAVVIALMLLVSSGAAQVAPLPAGFGVQEIPTNGTSLHVRVGATMRVRRFELK